jgi:hypothetical protein
MNYRGDPGCMGVAREAGISAVSLFITKEFPMTPQIEDVGAVAGKRAADTHEPQSRHPEPQDAQPKQPSAEAVPLGGAALGEFIPGGGSL